MDSYIPKLTSTRKYEFQLPAFSCPLNTGFTLSNTLKVLEITRQSQVADKLANKTKWPIMIRNKSKWRQHKSTLLFKHFFFFWMGNKKEYIKNAFIVKTIFIYKLSNWSSTLVVIYLIQL